MEISELVQAIESSDSPRTRELLRILRPQLVRFLRIQYNATRPDAEDCVQEALLICIESIHNNSLREPDRLLSFLLTTCRNNYLQLQNRKELMYGEIPRGQHHAPAQLSALLDQERNKILRWCLNQLGSEFRRFMEYWFNHPGWEAENVADHFGLSVSNTWTRKHRIIKLLNECYEKKSEI